MSRHIRRTTKRWLEGAPEYVFDVWDNGGATADRYTVLLGGEGISLSYPTPFGDEKYLATLRMSADPDWPQGVSMWGEIPANLVGRWRYENRHRKTRWLDLPENVRAHVILRAKEDEEE